MSLTRDNEICRVQYTHFHTMRGRWWSDDIESKLALVDITGEFLIRLCYLDFDQHNISW